jgi:hypothetical protein
MYSTNVPAANKVSYETLKQNPYCYNYCTVSKEWEHSVRCDCCVRLSPQSHFVKRLTIWWALLPCLHSHLYLHTFSFTKLCFYSSSGSFTSVPVCGMLQKLAMFHNKEVQLLVSIILQLSHLHQTFLMIPPQIMSCNVFSCTVNMVLELR